MIGLAIGAGALLGFMFIRHARHRHACAHGYGGYGGYEYGGGGWHGHGGWGGHHHHGGWGRFGRRARFYGAMAALDLSPAQEKLVRTEFDGLRERLRALRPELKQTREDVARSVAGNAFDRAAIDAAFARHDRALADVRGAFAGALERVHAALDDHQRERLAELLDRGGRGGGWGRRGPDAGPYRV